MDNSSLIARADSPKQATSMHKGHPPQPCGSRPCLLARQTPPEVLRERFPDAAARPDERGARALHAAAERGAPEAVRAGLAPQSQACAATSRHHGSA